MGIKKPKEETFERRKEILGQMISSIGGYNFYCVKVKELSDKYKVSIHTIYMDIDFWIKHLPWPDTNKTAKKLLHGFDTAIAVNQQVMVDERETALKKMMASRNYGELMKVFSTISKDMGYINPRPQKHIVAIADKKMLEEWEKEAIEYGRPKDNISG